MHDPAPILSELIACPSVTPQDAGALAVVERHLQAMGFATHRVTFSAPGTPDIANLYARLGTAAPNLLFAGHTDVVPPGALEAWTHPPFGGAAADGYIWGRGAVDMKGGIAAALAAVAHHLDQHGAPKGSISFLITGDEEGPAINGTTKLLDWALARGEVFDQCILGEPTNPRVMGEMIKIGRRGSLTGELVAEGRQGHVAYPHLASNPIPQLLRAMQALLATPLDQGTEAFDASNLEFTTVDVGNPAHNVIPARAQARFNIRFNDLWTHASLADELRRRVAAAESTCKLTFLDSNASAFLTRPGPFTTLFANAVTAETGLEPRLSTTGGTSDARFIIKACPVLEFGLVGDTMHAIDERVPERDLATLTRIYARVIAAYFAQG
ncbi:MAG: succinyl-diaminopimelate desuccinylase [Hyphomicrobiales bacterium]|nr:succinyl-diaminopimelate desuccinylase [Hyphomicrobiales bacterium]